MSNTPQGKVVYPGAPLYDETARWKWYGYNDVKDGLGYRKAYETADHAEQANYERGRCMAATMKYEWGVCPPWDPSLTVNAAFRGTVDLETVLAVNAETAFFNKGLEDERTK